MPVIDAQAIVDQYNSGRRLFRNLEIEGDFRSNDLREIVFEDCFIVGDFRHCDLRRAVFRNGNIKTCDFKYSDLRFSVFNNLAVDAAEFDWAFTEGIEFFGNWCFGQQIDEKDFEKAVKKNQSRPSVIVVEVFSITGRGKVIAIDVLQGKFWRGDSLVLNDEFFEIAAVEYLDKISKGIAHLAFLFKEADQERISHYLEQNIVGKTLEIVKKPKP